MIFIDSEYKAQDVTSDDIDATSFDPRFKRIWQGQHHKDFFTIHNKAWVSHYAIITKASGKIRIGKLRVASQSIWEGQKEAKKHKLVRLHLWIWIRFLTTITIELILISLQALSRWQQEKPWKLLVKKSQWKNFQSDSSAREEIWYIFGLE